MPYHISIDLRMVHHSGIGTYLRHLVPRVIAFYPDIQFALIGEAKKLAEYDWTRGNNIRLIDCQTPIYSIAEQFTLLSNIPKETTLFWSPHYNIPLFYKGRLLVTIHDLFHLAMPEFVGGLHKRIYAKIMFEAVRRKADAIITNSHFTKREFMRFVGAGHQEIIPVHLGVDDSWFKVEKASRPHEKPFLLYVGNVKPHKNLTTLVRAFGLLIDKIPHDLIIIGAKEGFITGDKRVFAEAASLGNRVLFIGHVKEEVLQQYVSHASALVLPSFYEGFGLPPLEAMAAGCPVIVSHAASLPEICGDAALYCDPYRYEDMADKILELFNNKGLAETLRRRGIQRAHELTWAKTVHETCAVINRLLHLGKLPESIMNKQ